jgi:hypothetical protein
MDHWQALIKQFSAYPEAVTVGEFQVTSSVQANMSEESYAFLAACL